MIQGRIRAWLISGHLFTIELSILEGRANNNRERMARGKVQQANRLLESKNINQP